MKLAALLNNRFSEIESRKKLVNIKSADNAYKKNANYFSPMSNPAMEELVDLLTGKKDKQGNLELDDFIEQVKRENLTTRSEVDTSTIDETLNNMRSNVIVSTSDLTPIENVSAHPLSKNTTSETLPVQLNDGRQISKERLTEKAINTYKSHMSMAKNEFEILQPMFYRTA
ncbi:MAG: hypothetical protein KBT36_02780 [Kurthia sp.]|nr:hypothetical protein [Candidatus Kurthia equi]